ncbi:Protein FixB [Geodia barretti]|uniref:Protein FixB n=1 Tax=Geodia barretti TaxID=519541 RepID=A0AA35SW46_GEOBA|nr:Protein FixB [Geodia barretti]
MPAVMTVTNELGEARYANLRGIMAATRSGPEVFTLADLGLSDLVEETKLEMTRLFVPVSESSVEFIEAAVLEGLDVGDVILLEHPEAGADGIGGVYSLTTELVCEAVQRMAPSVVLVSKTDAGSVVSARVAARFGAGLASDCIDLAVNAEGRVAVTRPVHGGNALAVYEFAGDGLQVVSVRPGAFEAVEGVSGMPEGKRVEMSAIEMSGAVPVLVETVLEESEGIPLEQADVVVSGGRGLWWSGAV